MSVTLADVLMRPGLGFVWGSFQVDKGLISKIILGGFKVDFLSRLKTCQPRPTGLTSFGLAWDWLQGVAQTTKTSPKLA